jgi:hypothetical protein
MNEPSKNNPGWRIVRGIFIALAVLATLIALFYTEEDWRGKRAWENCKRELEAQGAVLDWNKFLPPSVPDDQNFFTASRNILLKFKRLTATNDPDYKAARASNWLRLQITSSNSYPIIRAPIVAKLTVASGIRADIAQGTNVFLVNLNDPTAGERTRKLIQAVIGPNIAGAAGPQFYLFSLKDIRPAQIYVQAAMPPSDSALVQMIPSETRLIFANPADAVRQRSFEVEMKGENSLVSAADYLKWSDQFVPAFDEIREALRRPYAVLPGDYSNPAFMPIPDFVTMRALAQTLAQRAQCDILLGKPDEALHELTLIHNVCRILQKPPTGPPETLVEAMINVAISGLYADVISEGLQRHTWQESQLVALQEQLKETDLCPFLLEALQQQPAHISRIAETTTPIDWGFSKLFRWTEPRGWLYQMMAVSAKLQWRAQAEINLENNTIFPKKVDETVRDINKSLSSRSPFTLLARIAIPNWAKAWQTTSYNQSLVNEAQIACALERYHLAHSEYPETLNALVPQFIETIPHDIIGGAPLHYSRTPDGTFSLYSIGWNEIDDGGQPSPHVNGSYITDYTRGDWVWLGFAEVR